MSWWCSLFCLLTACRTTAPQTELVQRSQPLLGTFVTISAYGPDRATTRAAISAAFAEFQRADALMSIHRADSELTRINATAATNAVSVSPELFSVLTLAQAIATETAGAFDVTIHPLTDLWGFIWKEYRLPTEVELARTLPSVNFRHVELDSVAHTVRFVRPGISLDLGGIGKGVAVDWAFAKLQSLGISNVLVKAGGDLRVGGSPPGKTHWTVQLEDPIKAGRRVTIPLRDAALSTSGNYENYFTVNGRRYSHILDPRTGLPVEGIAACTVIAPTCAESDAWATACFVYGIESSLQQFGGRQAIRFTGLQQGTLFIRQTASFPPPRDSAQ